MKRFVFTISLAIAMASCSTDEQRPEKQASGQQEPGTLQRYDDHDDAALLAKARTYAGTSTPSDKINCHTSYYSASGHACVTVGGTLYEVTWSDIPAVPNNWPEHTVWTTVANPRCKC